MRLTDCETLTAGSQADLIVIDLNQPNMQPVNNISKNLVYSGSKQNVQLTMIAGKILYENGTFDVGTDVQEIYHTCSEITQKLKTK